MNDNQGYSSPILANSKLGMQRATSTLFEIQKSEFRLKKQMYGYDQSKNIQNFDQRAGSEQKHARGDKSRDFSKSKSQNQHLKFEKQQFQSFQTQALNMNKTTKQVDNQHTDAQSYEEEFERLNALNAARDSRLQSRKVSIHSNKSKTSADFGEAKYNEGTQKAISSITKSTMKTQFKRKHPKNDLFSLDLENQPNEKSFEQPQVSQRINLLPIDRANPKENTCIDETNYFSFNNTSQKNEINFVRSKAHTMLNQKVNSKSIIEQNQSTAQENAQKQAGSNEERPEETTSKQADLGISQKDSHLSQASHARQDTVQASEFPIKSAKMKEFSQKKSLIKKPSQNSRSNTRIVSTDRYNFNQTFKDRKLSEFNRLVGNKLSLRLQNLKVLSASTFIDQHNLTHLDLRNNRLKRLPDQICDLILLREMKLDYNFLSSLPYGLYRLQSLQFLSASQNHLKQIPSSKKLLNKDSMIEFLHLNDNKITSVPKRLGNLQRLKSLFLHNNPIYQIPNTFGNFHFDADSQPPRSAQLSGRRCALEELSLDWFLYLYSEEAQCKIGASKTSQKRFDWGQFSEQDKQQLLSLPTLTKILKIEDNQQENEHLCRNHKLMIEEFLKLCLFMQIIDAKKQIDQFQSKAQVNPQQDDFEEINHQERQHLRQQHSQNQQNPEIITQSRNLTTRFLRNNQKQSIKSSQSLENVNFLQFLMYFQRIESLDHMVTKAILPSKQIKLSHQLAMYGHVHLMQQSIAQIRHYEATIEENSKSLSPSIKNSYSRQGSRSPSPSDQDQSKLIQGQQFKQQALYQFINSVDMDFSSPLIYAIKNKKNQIVRLLLKNPKICLKEYSMKFGSPLHVALHHRDFKSSLKMLQMLKDQGDTQQFQRLDEEENTLLHIVMRNFNSDADRSKRIAQYLLFQGANIQKRNKLNCSPLSTAFANSQSEAIRFALSHNQKMRQSDDSQTENSDKLMFDFNETSGQHGFTPMHYAVISNNFTMISMLLSSQENLNLEIRDNEDRIPLDLCYSISSIYKTLKRAQKKNQGARERIKSKALSNSNQVDYLSENLKHENINRRNIHRNSDDRFFAQTNILHTSGRRHGTVKISERPSLVDRQREQIESFDRQNFSPRHATYREKVSFHQQNHHTSQKIYEDQMVEPILTQHKSYPSSLRHKTPVVGTQRQAPNRRTKFERNRASHQDQKSTRLQHGQQAQRNQLIDERLSQIISQNTVYDYEAIESTPIGPSRYMSINDIQGCKIDQSKPARKSHKNQVLGTIDADIKSSGVTNAVKFDNIDQTPKILGRNSHKDVPSTVVIPLGDLIHADNSATQLRMVNKFDERQNNGQTQFNIATEIPSKGQFFNNQLQSVQIKNGFNNEEPPQRPHTLNSPLEVQIQDQARLVVLSNRSYGKKSHLLGSDSGSEKSRSSSKSELQSNSNKYRQFSFDSELDDKSGKGMDIIEQQRQSCFSHPKIASPRDNTPLTNRNQFFQVNVDASKSKSKDRIRTYRAPLRRAQDQQSSSSSSLNRQRANGKGKKGIELVIQRLQESHVNIYSQTNDHYILQLIRALEIPLKMDNQQEIFNQLELINRVVQNLNGQQRIQKLIQLKLQHQLPNQDKQERQNDEINNLQCDFDISDAESSAMKENLSKHIKNLSSTQFPLGSTINVPKLQVNFDGPHTKDKHDLQDSNIETDFQEDILINKERSSAPKTDLRKMLKQHAQPQIQYIKNMKKQKAEKVNVNDSNVNKSRLSYLKSGTNMSHRGNFTRFEDLDGSIEDENMVDFTQRTFRNQTVRGMSKGLEKQHTRNDKLITLKDDQRAAITSHIISIGSLVKANGQQTHRSNFQNSDIAPDDDPVGPSLHSNQLGQNSVRVSQNRRRPTPGPLHDRQDSRSNFNLKLHMKSHRKIQSSQAIDIEFSDDQPPLKIIGSIISNYLSIVENDEQIFQVNDSHRVKIVQNLDKIAPEIGTDQSKLVNLQILLRDIDTLVQNIQNHHWQAKEANYQSIRRFFGNIVKYELENIYLLAIQSQKNRKLKVGSKQEFMPQKPSISQTLKPGMQQSAAKSIYSGTQAPVTFGKFDPKVDKNPSDENMELIMSIDFYRDQDETEQSMAQQIKQENAQYLDQTIDEDVVQDDGNATPVLDLTKGGNMVNPQSNIIIQRMNQGRSKTDHKRPVYTENYIKNNRKQQNPQQQMFYNRRENKNPYN